MLQIATVQAGKMQKPPDSKRRRTRVDSHPQMMVADTQVITNIGVT
jgi:hypothetical protein